MSKIHSYKIYSNPDFVFGLIKADRAHWQTLGTVMFLLQQDNRSMCNLKTDNLTTIRLRNAFIKQVDFY